MSSTVTNRANPFPGLRPFEENEDDLFFGRDDQIDDLVGRLRRRRLIAVIGTSGSGKSSLVRAGLLPALHGGFMAGVGSRWRIATMRPGSAPIANLADALDKAGLTGSPDIDRETRVGLARAGLDRGSLGLVDVLRESNLGKTENVLLLVDQFEELFRFQQEHPNEAAAFVKLLLTGTESPDVPLYVILTMRSDFLGDCAQFEDLAYRINDALFLVPRMTWDQLREAIEMPVRAAGADIDPALVTRLLNDLGDNPDQLPVLQHALMRTWDLRPDDGGPIVLTLDDLARTGGLDDALSNHGDAVLASLDESDRLAAEKMFKCVTELASDNRGIRRPTRLGDICAITGTSFEQMSRVVEAFRAPGCSFLAIRPGPLTENTIVDIAHEGLMRIGHKLAAWVVEEAASAAEYRRLAMAATLHAQGLAALWRNPDLQVAENWREKEAPNAAWSRQIDPRLDFAQTMSFLDKSIEERRRERAGRIRQVRLVIGGLTALVLVMAAIALYAVQEANVAAKERTQTLIAESHFLARDADAAVDRGDAVTGMLLALQAEDVGGANRPIETEYVLANALANQRERRDLLGHTDAVQGVAFSPDGKHVVSAGDLTVRVWNAADGTPLQVYHGPKASMTWVQYSADGREILAAASDNTARIIDVASGTTVLVVHTPDLTQSATFSPDASRIVTALNDHTARVYDAKTGRELLVLRGHTDYVSYAEFSHDGKLIVTASADKTVRLWNAATGAPIAVLRGHTDLVPFAVFSPDGRRVASVSQDGTVRLWDTATHAQVGSFAHAAGACISYSPDGRLLATSSQDGTIRLWDAEHGRPVAVLAGHEGPVYAIAFSPDSKHVVSGSFDTTVRIWNVDDGVTSRVLDGSGTPMFTANYSPDGTRFVSGSDEGFLRVWDAASGKLVMKIAHANGGGRYSPDGTLIATGRKGIVRIVDARTGALVRVLKGHTRPLDDLQFSPDGKFLASSSLDRTARVWNVRTGALISVFRGSTDQVNGVSFSPDGKLVVSASNDSTARIWNPKNGALIRTLRGHQGPVYDAQFSPDGTRILTSSLDRTIRIWDAASGDEIIVLRGHQGGVSTAQYSPDGKTIVSSALDDTVRIWDADKGIQIAVLPGHGSFVYDATYAPDGRHIVSASQDGTLRIWDLHPRLAGDDLRQAAVAALPRQLTAYQREQEFLTTDKP